MEFKKDWYSEQFLVPHTFWLTCTLVHRRPKLQNNCFRSHLSLHIVQKLDHIQQKMHIGSANIWTCISSGQLFRNAFPFACASTNWETLLILASWHFCTFLKSMTREFGDIVKNVEKLEDTIPMSTFQLWQVSCPNKCLLVLFCVTTNQNFSKGDFVFDFLSP